MARHFDSEGTRNYDRRIRMMIPGYEALHGMAHSLLQLDLGEQARLLVVGAGTGTEIAYLGEEEPGWQFTGVDPSADILAIARQRVIDRGLSQSVRLHTGFAQELPTSEFYDAATLILVMHFIPDDGEKLGLLQAISARLRPGAPFILADLAGDRTSDRFARLIAAWRRLQLASGIAAEDLGSVEEMFDYISANVHPVPEKRITALLDEAGFDHVEPFYRALVFGGWVARRSAVEEESPEIVSGNARSISTPQPVAPGKNLPSPLAPFPSFC